MRFRMGLFDGDSLSNPYRQIDLSEVGSSEDLSLEAARKSMVLLKNAGVNANGQTGVRMSATTFPLEALNKEIQNEQQHRRTHVLELS